jgi:hypothetical protein
MSVPRNIVLYEMLVSVMQHFDTATRYPNKHFTKSGRQYSFFVEPSLRNFHIYFTLS